MTDRELLEAAAEAAGVDFIISGGQLWTTMDGSIHKHTERWNPLANDGQALRLSVKLGIQIRQYPIYDTPRFAAYACESKWDSDAQKNIGPEALVQYDGDPYAATRRAIVRAAAALTRMESNHSKEG